MVRAQSPVPLSLTCFVPKDMSHPALFLPAHLYRGTHNVTLLTQCYVHLAPMRLCAGIVATAPPPAWGGVGPFCACSKWLQKHLCKQKSLPKGDSSK